MIDLILDDCMNVMKKYEDNHFDLAIVDPPYGIGASKMTMGKGSRNDKKKNKLKDWDNCIPDKEYFDELFRVSKNQIISCGNYFIDYLYNTRCFLMWDKLDYNSDFASHELAWTSFNKNTKCFRRARNKGNDIKIHPTQKPVKLYEWLLHNYAEKGQKILDTHLGSGSIAIACHYFGVDLVGVEIDEEYYNKAKERVDLLTRQETLF